MVCSNARTGVAVGARVICIQHTDKPALFTVMPGGGLIGGKANLCLRPLLRPLCGHDGLRLRLGLRLTSHRGCLVLPQSGHAGLSLCLGLYLGLRRLHGRLHGHMRIKARAHKRGNCHIRHGRRGRGLIITRAAS